MNVAAGWYDDSSGQLRWWDGTAWTELVAPFTNEQLRARAATPDGWYAISDTQSRRWVGGQWTDQYATTASVPRKEPVAPEQPVLVDRVPHETLDEVPDHHDDAAVSSTASTPAGLYDDGTGRDRWSDGTAWGSYTQSDVYTVPGGGVAIDVKPEWPLWFVMRSDAADPRQVHIRVHTGFDPSEVPSFEKPNHIAEVEIADWEGAPLNMAVHSSQREVIASLGTDMVEILADVGSQVQAAVDRVGYGDDYDD